MSAFSGKLYYGNPALKVSYTYLFIHFDEIFKIFYSFFVFVFILGD